MVSLRDIRNRIKSIKSTEKITRAMKMISAVKLRKSQNSLKNYLIYFKEMEKCFFEIIKNGDISDLKTFSLFNSDSNKDICILFLTSDKGLCGSFNTGINKKRIEIFKDFTAINKQIQYIIFGKKGFDLVKKENLLIKDKYFDLENILKNKKSFEVSNNILNLILCNNFSELYVIYNKFESIAVQKIVCEKIYPFVLEDYKDLYFEIKPEILNYEDKKNLFLEEFFNQFFISKLNNIFLNSILSEYSFRMKAMESANKNSKEMIDKLVLFYNRSRQSLITTELIEIISGAESSK